MDELVKFAFDDGARSMFAITEPEMEALRGMGFHVEQPFLPSLSEEGLRRLMTIREIREG